MRQGGIAGAARLLVLCALAVCAFALRAPMHSPGMSPAAARAGSSAAAPTSPVLLTAAQAALGHGERGVAASADEAGTDGPDQGPCCECCAHAAATCCTARATEDSSPHRYAPTTAPCEHDPGNTCAGPGAVHSRVLLAPGPSLSELSLLRI